MDESGAIAVEPEQKVKPRRQPPYHVLLHDDDDHSYEYVMAMMIKLFAKKPEDAYEIANQVHKRGKAICTTTTREHAELKVEQIHAFGADPLIQACAGAMTATAEPAR
jgi:ATP-dependent Clp protease adaptor protein ClpS